MKEFKSDNEFDKLFQDTLKGDSITPSDNVWENIESRLDNESNKPKFIFWLSLFIGIVLIGTISFLALEKSKTANPIAENSSNSQSALSADKKTIPVSEQNSSTHLLSNSQTKSENTPNTTAEKTSTDNDQKENLTPSINTISPEPENNNIKKSVSKNKEPKIITHEKNLTINNASVTKKARPIKSENTSSIHESKKETTTSIPLVAKTITETNKTPEPSVTKHVSPKTPALAQASDEKKVSDNTKTATKENSSSAKAMDGKEKELSVVTASDNKTLNEKAIDEKSSSVKTPDEKENKTDANKISAIDSSSTKKVVAATTFVKKDSLITKDSVKNKADTIPEKNIVKNAPPKLIDSLVTKPTIPFAVTTLYAFYSPDYFYSKPTASTSGNYNPSIEKQVVRFSTGMKIEYRPIRMIGIQIGCAYSEIKQEKEESELRFSKYITAPYSIYSSLGEMKVDASIMKDGFYMIAPVDTFRFKTTYTQSVNFLNVPVNIKLNLLKSRFNVYIDAGLNTQIALSQHSTLNLIKENFTNTIDYNDIKINRFNYSVLLGLGAEYKVYKRLGIYIEPNIRYGLNNMSKVGGIINKPIILGGYGGICIYL